MAKRQSILFRLLAWGGGFVLLIAIAIWVMILIARHRLEAYRAELEARGEIFNVRQLAPPPAPTSGNGANALITACEDVIALVKKNNLKQYELGQLQTIPGEAEILHRRHATQQQKTDVPWEKFESEVAPLRPLLARVREASQAEVLEIQTDYTRGLSTSFPYLTLALGASQHLGRETLLFLRERNYADAVANVQTMLRISSMVAKQHSLISQLVSLSIIQIASVSTWEILNSEAPREEIDKLGAAWALIKPSANFVASLRMERAEGCEIFNWPVYKLASASAPLGGVPLSFSSGPSSFAEAYNIGIWAMWAATFRYSDERRYLQDHQNFLECIDSKNNGNALVSRTNDAESFLESAKFSRPLSLALLPSVFEGIRRHTKVDALRELTVTAIALRLYQLDHEGKLPDSFESLVPNYLATVSLDPIDLQPLRYQNKGSHFIVYSIGADGVDDGGNASEPKGKHARQLTDRIDIVWPIAAPQP